MFRCFFTGFWVAVGLLSLSAAAQNAAQFDPSQCRPDGEVVACTIDGKTVHFPPEMFAAMMGGTVVQKAYADTSTPDPKLEQNASSPAQIIDGVALTQALNDVIVTDSRGWMFNRYDNNSVRNVKITERSADGKTYVVYGEYTFNGGRIGHVQVKMQNDEVACIKFWDSPSCRAIGRSHSQGLVAAAILGAMTSDGSSSGSAGGRHCERTNYVPYGDGSGRMNEICEEWSN